VKAIAHKERIVAGTVSDDCFNPGNASRREHASQRPRHREGEGDVSIREGEGLQWWRWGLHPAVATNASLGVVSAGSFTVRFEPAARSPPDLCPASGEHESCGKTRGFDGRQEPDAIANSFFVPPLTVAAGRTALPITRFRDPARKLPLES
jgi:hypothetical protein